MLLPPFRVLMFVWWFLHLMSLIPCKIFITIIWLVSMEHETSLIHMDGWVSTGIFFPLMQLIYCGLVRSSPSFTLYVFPLICLWDLWHWNECSYSRISLYMPLCFHFSQSFNDLTLKYLTPWGNWGICWPVLQKWSSDMPCGVVGVSLS